VPDFHDGLAALDNLKPRATDKMDRNSISGQKKGKKLALGRGLDALIPGFDTKEPAAKEFFQCDIDLIRRNRHQPRRRIQV